MRINHQRAFIITGMLSSLLAFFSALIYAVSLLLSMVFYNITIGNTGMFFSGIVIALSFIFMVYSYLVFSNDENKPYIIFSLILSIVYFIYILFGYSIQFSGLFFLGNTEKKFMLSNYYNFESFLNFNIFGYLLLSLSSFFIGLSIETNSKKDNILKLMMLNHTIFGIFFILSLFKMIFNYVSDYYFLTGLVIKIKWCIYFSLICILSFGYFRKTSLSV